METRDIHDVLTVSAIIASYHGEAASNALLISELINWRNGSVETVAEVPDEPKSKPRGRKTESFEPTPDPVAEADDSVPDF